MRNLKRFWYKSLGGVNGLLDAYPATALWSLDNSWYTAYSGPVIEVYNGIIYQDFFPAEIINGTLATFLNNADGLVRTQYDVTGNGRHQIAVLTTDMYIIAIAGVVNIDAKGQPFLSVPSTVDTGFRATFNINGEGGAYAVHRAPTNYTQGILFVGGANHFLGLNKFGSVATNTGQNVGTTNTEGTFYKNGNLIGATYPATEGEVFASLAQDQAEVLGFFKADNFQNWPFAQLFNYTAGSGSYFSKPYEYKSVLLYSDGNYVSTDQSAIETIINDFYSIYPGVGFNLDDYMPTLFCGGLEYMLSGYTGPVITFRNRDNSQQLPCTPTQIKDGTLAAWAGLDRIEVGIIHNQIPGGGVSNFQGNTSGPARPIIADEGIYFTEDGKYYMQQVVGVAAGLQFTDMVENGIGSAFIKYRSSDTAYNNYFLSEPYDNPYLGFMQVSGTTAADSLAGSPIYYKNGVALTNPTANDLYNSFVDGNWNHLSIMNIDWTNFQELYLGAKSFQPLGRHVSDYRYLVLYGANDDQTANMSEIETILDNIYY